MFFEYHCDNPANGDVDAFSIKVGAKECEMVYTLRVATRNNDRKCGRCYFKTDYTNIETLLHDLRNGWLYGQAGSGSAYGEVAHDLRLYDHGVKDAIALNIKL